MQGGSIRCSDSKIFYKTHSQSDGGAVKMCGGGASLSKVPTPTPAPSFITSLRVFLYGLF